MWWCEKTIPPRNVVQTDLESRGVDFTQWTILAQQNHNLLHKLNQCYARHNGRRRFDMELHKCGIKLRLDFYCQWVLREYPELHNDAINVNPDITVPLD